MKEIQVLLIDYFAKQMPLLEQTLKYMKCS